MNVINFFGQRFPVTKNSGRTGLLLMKTFVIQSSDSEKVTGSLKEIKLAKSLKSIYEFLNIM